MENVPKEEGHRSQDAEKVLSQATSITRAQRELFTLLGVCELFPSVSDLRVRGERDTDRERKNVVRLFWVMIVTAISVVGASSSTWSETSAAAKPATPSMSRPSTISIRKDLLVAERAELERQMRGVQRCIEQARMNLQGEKGRINRIAAQDLVSCSRTVGTLQRKLASLGRRAEDLARDAEALAMRFEALKQRLETRERIETGSGRSSMGSGE